MVNGDRRLECMPAAVCTSRRATTSAATRPGSRNTISCELSRSEAQGRQDRCFVVQLVAQGDDVVTAAAKP
jgi:hypothetical protein